MRLSYFARRDYNRGQFDFPPTSEMIDSMERASDPALKTMIAAHKSGVLSDPETGRSVSINAEACSLAEMAFLHWAAVQCNSDVSVDVGFGLGMSAAAIIAGRAGRHLTIDPDLLGGRGELALRILARPTHAHIRKWSQHALPELASDLAGACSLIFIDGGHQFENVIVDFALSDALCAVGGLIIFDDADYPAIEAVISYIKANRADYDISHLVVDGLTVIRKSRADQRTWDHFRPFNVPWRSDWQRRHF